MCGIAGYIGECDKRILRKMLDVISYRGPDDWGVYTDKGVGLGNRRLSIIDLKTGKQPIHNEEGDVWVVYNGEIYNYKNLRSELEKKKHKFYTASDTEVLVHAYEEWGEEFVRRLRGMFALALWDGNRKRLLLARDWVGEKPLYFADAGGTLLFGSEIKSILQHPSVKRKVNPDSLSYYLSFGCTPPEDTMLSGIHKLQPAHVMICDKNGKKTTTEYARLTRAQRETSEEAAVERVRALLKSSVNSRLMSDVPLGAFLSGGIDSASTVALMSEICDAPVKTFTVGFGEEDDEFGYAKRISEEFGTEHHELNVGYERLPSLLPKIIWHMDDPLSDSTMFPTYLVSELASRHVKVVLVGEGGDEIFGGYPRYSPLADWWYAPRGVRLWRYMRYVTVFKDGAKNRLLKKPGAPAWEYAKKYFSGGASLLDCALEFETKTLLPDDLLLKADKMSMAHSIEARAPFLDYELVEYAATLPPRMKFQNGVGKLILRKAVSGLVPRETLERAKHGFSVPLARWFSSGALDFAVEKLRDKTMGEYFDSRTLNSYVESRTAKDHARLWHLLVFAMWHRIFIDAEKITAPKS